MKFISILLLCFLAFAGCQNFDASYEATWLELTETADGYVVYNYHHLFGPEISPVEITVKSNTLVWNTFNDEEVSYEIEAPQLQDDGSYFFNVGNNFAFKMVDKEKHIAQWTVYMGDERVMQSNYYIDSRYNKYPVVEYKWSESDYE